MEVNWWRWYALFWLASNLNTQNKLSSSSRPDFPSSVFQAPSEDIGCSFHLADPSSTPKGHMEGICTAEWLISPQPIWSAFLLLLWELNILPLALLSKRSDRKDVMLHLASSTAPPTLLDRETNAQLHTNSPFLLYSQRWHLSSLKSFGASASLF